MLRRKSLPSSSNPTSVNCHNHCVAIEFPSAQVNFVESHGRLQLISHSRNGTPPPRRVFIAITMDACLCLFLLSINLFTTPFRDKSIHLWLVGCSHKSIICRWNSHNQWSLGDSFLLLRLLAIARLRPRWDLQEIVALNRWTCFLLHGGKREAQHGRFNLGW